MGFDVACKLYAVAAAQQSAAANSAAWASLGRDVAERGGDRSTTSVRIRAACGARTEPHFAVRVSILPLSGAGSLVKVATAFASPL